jgi:mannose/fructose/N-acetylgalactosamine-specific phosphotransferase system component IIC
MTFSLIVAALILAAVELDAASAAQVMLSRPAVFGPLVGTALGEPALGAGLGAIWELLTLDEAPIGGYLPINATAAAGASLLLCAGPGGVAPEAAFAWGAASGWAHRRLEAVLRRRRAACAARCDTRLALGQAPRLGRTAWLELGKQAAMTFAVLALALAARPVLGHWWPSAPDSLQGALRLGLAASPWLGIAALLHVLRVLA